MKKGISYAKGGSTLKPVTKGQKAKAKMEKEIGKLMNKKGKA